MTRDEKLIFHKSVISWDDKIEQLLAAKNAELEKVPKQKK